MGQDRLETIAIISIKSDFLINLPIPKLYFPFFLSFLFKDQRQLQSEQNFIFNTLQCLQFLTLYFV